MHGSIILRDCVTVPSTAALPDRVRLMIKERGALFFPYRRKLATVRLHLASWTILPDAVWQSNTVQTVAMDVPKMLRKAQRQRLALQAYCLHRRTVSHKAIGGLERLLQEGNGEELLLDLHYPGCNIDAHVRALQATGSD